MLRLALRAVVGDSFLPDDDYTTQVRKTTVIAHAVASVGHVISLLVNVRAAVQASDEAFLIAAVASIFVACFPRRDAYDCLSAHVHNVGAKYHASVHTWLGDTITLTWNATRKAVRPEAKACRFALRLLSAKPSAWLAPTTLGAVHSHEQPRSARLDLLPSVVVSVAAPADDVDVTPPFVFAGLHRNWECQNHVCGHGDEALRHHRLR